MSIRAPKHWSTQPQAAFRREGFLRPVPDRRKEGGRVARDHWNEIFPLAGSRVGSAPLGERGNLVARPSKQIVRTGACALDAKRAARDQLQCDGLGRDPALTECGVVVGSCLPCRLLGGNRWVAEDGAHTLGRAVVVHEPEGRLTRQSLGELDWITDGRRRSEEPRIGAVPRGRRRSRRNTCATLEPKTPWYE